MAWKFKGAIGKTLPGGDAPGEVDPGAVVDYRREEEEETGAGGGGYPDEMQPRAWRWRAEGHIHVRGRARIRRNDEPQIFRHRAHIRLGGNRAQLELARQNVTALSLLLLLDD